LSEVDTDIQSRHPFVEFRRERRWTTLLALAIAILLHMAVVVLLPEQILVQSEIAAGGDEQALEVELLPPEPLTPDEMRFVEASPDAPQNEPDRKDQYSFRAQQAADESPIEDLLNAPKVEGEDEASQKILQGAMDPAPPVQGGVFSPAARLGEGEGTDGGKAGSQAAQFPQAEPLPAPAFIQQKPVDEEGPGSSPELPGEATEVFPNADPEAAINVYRPTQSMQPTQVQAGSGGAVEARPMPRERPRLSPELIHGPLMRSLGSANRRGSVAIDATFSEFGEYQQQFYAALQAGWYQEIEFFQPIDTASRVMVSFTIRSDGSIHDAEIVHTTASEIASLICQSAITKRSPFRPWTKEMVKVFGQERTLRVVFHYR
jgi:hypothetical protein